MGSDHAVVVGHDQGRPVGHGQVDQEDQTAEVAISEAGEPGLKGLK